ncbi:HAD hydrolase-like protein [Candidatus Woesearchaeota archaeon]|nr:HAD hydrolase-like protein [Candidatus Woesearchaeota archaeon]
MNLALFDIDGTLLQNTKAHQGSFRSAVGNIYGIDLDMHDMTQYPGWTDRSIIIAIARQYGVPDAFINDALPDCIGLLERTFSNEFAKERLQVLPGAAELLRALDGRAHQGVVTGNCANIGYTKLARVEFDRYIKVGAFGSERTVRSELVALAKSRATEQRMGYKTAIVIGDTPRDVLAAQEGGAKCIAVATGNYSIGELSAAGADVVVATLEDTNHLVNLITEF